MAISTEQINKNRAKAGLPPLQSDFTSPNTTQNTNMPMAGGADMQALLDVMKKNTPTTAPIPKKGVLESIGEKRGSEVLKTISAQKRGDQGLFSTATQIGGQVLGGASDVIGAGFMGAVKAITPKPVEEAVAKGATRAISSLMGTRPGQFVAKQAQKLEADTEKTRSIKSLLGAGSLALDATGVGLGTKAVNPVVKNVTEQIAAQVTKTQAKRLPKKLEKIGFQKDVQNLVSNADEPTKTGMSNLLRLAEQKDLSKLQVQPIYQIGKDFMQSVDLLSKEAKNAANVIKKEVAKARNTVVDTSRARKNFIRELTKMDAGVTNDGKILFGNRIENTKDQALLQEMLDFVSQPQGVKDIYRKNQSLFDKLKLGAKNNELSIAENLTNRLRSDLRNIVGKELPINEAQKTYAKIEQTLQPINKLLGSRYTPEDLATAKVSEVIGRLLNRNAGRPTEMLREIVREAAKLNGKNPDKEWSNFLRKVEFTDVIEDVYGIAPSRSLRSQIGKGVTEPLTDVAFDFVPYGGTIKTVAKGLLGREKSLKSEQIKSLKNLLQMNKKQ